MSKLNADYELQDRISLGGKHYVLGEHTNPNAPARFVTWETDEEQKSFWWGHYFSERSDAQLDLLRRSSERIDLDEQSIGMALLTENDHTKLHEQFREEIAHLDIESALVEEMDCQDVKYNISALLNDPDFMSRAMFHYHNLDHSFDNEALRDKLAMFLDDYPQYAIPEKQPQKVEIRIPPELNAIIVDLLNIPTAQVPEKYGPLGDNLSFDFPLENGNEATLELAPAYEMDGCTLSETEPHHVSVQVRDASGKILEEEMIFGSERKRPAQLGENIFEFQHSKISVSLQEDETLRRVGSRFTFKSSSESEYYMQHDGEVCTIRRALTPQECDILCVGQMWAAEFPNGDIAHVFDRELSGPVSEPVLKPSLSEQIQSADDRKASNPVSEKKSPNRTEADRC